MWYKDKPIKPALDYNKPIVAVGRKSGDRYLLLPCLDGADNSYNVKGYNWFRLKDGEWNSCRYWKTPEAAVRAYRSHDIFNVELNVEKING